jgi:hypothetical protein
MNKADQLYERAVACHQRAANSLRESEKKGWLELATIWLILAESASAKRIQFNSADALIELSIEDVVSSFAAGPINPPVELAPGWRQTKRNGQAPDACASAM